MMNATDLVVARTFLSAIEAELALSALRAAGIPAMMRRDDCGGIRPSLWLSGVAILVRACDVVAATNVLEAPTASIVARAPDRVLP
jgi:hypothetical protein